MSMWFGKHRSKFGDYLNMRGIQQKWLAEQAGLAEATISELASGRRQAPNMRTANKIIKVLRTLDPDVSAEYFWG